MTGRPQNPYRMKPTVSACQAPPQSAVAARLAGAHFHDAWSVVAAEPGLSALGQFLRAAAATPGWVNVLMSIRNQAAAAIGLKNLGGLGSVGRMKAEADYQPGDRVGIFTLIENTPQEVLMGDNDKHLEVVLSVHRALPSASGETIVTVTTVVHIHNLLGRLYMLPVAPLHKIIAPSVLQAIGRTRVVV